MLRYVIAAVALVASPARAQGSWNLEYSRVMSRMHAEPVTIQEHGTMKLRTERDSLVGELVLADSTRLLLRGTAKAAAWTLYAEEPQARGIAVLLVPLELAMDWLRETVHGVQPVVVRFELLTKGDSLTGSRIVTGGMASAPRISSVRGARAKR